MSRPATSPVTPVSHPPLDPAFGPAQPWPDLAPGVAIGIVKLGPDGHEVVRYPGLVLGTIGAWVVTEARWVNPPVQVGELAFRTGDRLIEWFSPAHPFNCFTVVDPDTGLVRGWYANVTYPTRFDAGTTPPRILWHDLYLDVVSTADGDPVLHDQDELDASDLARIDPALHRAITAAALRIMAEARQRTMPFVTAGWPELPHPNDRPGQ